MLLERVHARAGGAGAIWVGRAAAAGSAEWAAAGFSPAEATAYRAAWCHDPRSAAELRDAGVTPELAARRVGLRACDTVGHWFQIGIYTIEDAMDAGFIQVAPGELVH